MKLVIGGVAQGKLDYVLENMIEKTEKYDVYDCFFLKDNACNDKASNMEWPWDFAVDDERILIIDKFHYFIRAVLEKNLPLQEYILKFMQIAKKNKDTIVIADEIGNGIVPLDAFEREYREQTGRAEPSGQSSDGDRQRLQSLHLAQILLRLQYLHPLPHNQ